MNDFHDDAQIRKFMKSHPPAQPPASLMKNYEQEVLRKIHTSGQPGSGFSPALGFSAAAALLLAGGLAFYFFGLRPQTMPAAAPRETLVIQSPVEDTSLATPPWIPSTESEQEAVMADTSEEAMSRDLLILEMLGEDDGILEGFEPLALELNGWQSASAATAAL
ncbi:MAG: hypothetical protein COW13_00510 [Candidatus Omnitrophica bacterium CG12_big_fil_rev_8_21_14_0_65_50_5]|nr:MAG: hypothetical protein COW13_00510 [Candidatus Omnitrophica bacterium CG12_big_fil_rev_8_21_14_0_65_50_5]